MKNLFLILVLFGPITNASAQSILLWSKGQVTGLAYYFSDNPQVTAAHDTIQISGVKNTASRQRLLLVKYNLNGDLLSTTTYENDSVSKNT